MVHMVVIDSARYALFIQHVIPSRDSRRGNEYDRADSCVDSNGRDG